jgi:putative flippase GtrA
MTRKQLNRILGFVVVGLLTLIAIALAAKLSGIQWALNLYEFIRDTSLLIVTVIAAYMAYVYQRRTTFLQNLREQWREIVQAKASLIYYCHLAEPTLDDYLHAARQLSECIDNMRIVYANVGETDELVGLYPYSPLHHMRMVMEKLDPRLAHATAEEKYAARGEIWDSFNAVREYFLDEFDIEEPTRPVLVYRMKRRKRDGAAEYALKWRDKQQKTLDGYTNR